MTKIKTHLPQNALSSLFIYLFKETIYKIQQYVKRFILWQFSALLLFVLLQTFSQSKSKELSWHKPESHLKKSGTERTEI